MMPKSSEIEGLTDAQRRILERMSEPQPAGDLINGDECLPAWWVEGGFAVNSNAAKALSRTPFVQYYRHEGGQPGIDRYRITDLGRAALSARPRP